MEGEYFLTAFLRGIIYVLVVNSNIPFVIFLRWKKKRIILYDSWYINTLQAL
jgi:hypothetical protein